MRLELEPGDTDMIVFLHSEEKVFLRIKSQVILRKLSAAELRDQTDKKGDTKSIPGSKCTFKSLKTPHLYGVLL